MRKQRQPWTKKQQLIFGMIVLVVTVIVSITAMLVVAVKPYVDAEKQVIAIAKTKADLHTVSEFNIYNGQATYYGLLGKSGQGEKLAVIVSHDSGEVDIYKQSDGISKSVAKKAAKAYGAKDISYVCLLYTSQRLSSHPPKKALHLNTTFQSEGTYISTPPQLQSKSMYVSPGAIWAVSYTHLYMPLSCRTDVPTGIS